MLGRLPHFCPGGIRGLGKLGCAASAKCTKTVARNFPGGLNAIPSISGPISAQLVASNMDRRQVKFEEREERRG